MKLSHFFSVLVLCAFMSAVPSVSSLAMSAGLYEISNVTGDYVLDAKTCTALEGNDFHTLQLYDRLDINQQKFYLEEMPDSSWRLSLVSSGEAVTLASDEDGSTSVVLSDLRQDATISTRKVQSFRLTETEDGFFYIQTQDGSYLTLDDSFAHRGTEVILKNFTGRDNQKWQLTKTWISNTDNADTDLFNPYTAGGRYENLVISIKTDEMLERLTAGRIAEWVSISEEEHALIFDTEAMTSYVQGLADEYSTVGKERSFTTTAGEEITISEGTYGWKMNVDETVIKLQEAARHNGSVTMEAVWDSKGVILTEDGEDVADSYIEVDLTNQHMWMYKDGELLVSSDCVSGTYHDEERRTPEGIYSIFYKQSPAVLKGEDYSSDVTYWMPFNGNIGLHDATWRNEFGGDIFQWNGSHGCINLPYDAAEILYENTYIGYIVILYY